MTDGAERDQRFPRRLRILAKKEYDRVFAHGRKAVRRSLVVIAAPRPEGETDARLGMAVSGKFGKAVVRNKMRRRLREIFRKHRHELPPGIDYVAIARKRDTPCTFEEIERDFLRAAAEAGAAAVQSEPESPHPPG